LKGYLPILSFCGKVRLGRPWVLSQRCRRYKLIMLAIGRFRDASILPNELKNIDNRKKIG